MAAKTVRRRCPLTHHGRRHVPAVAREAAHWGLVSEHGHARFDRAILRHGDIPPLVILRDSIYGPARIMVVSEPIRGRWIFRQFPARMGMARGEI